MPSSIYRLNRRPLYGKSIKTQIKKSKPKSIKNHLQKMVLEEGHLKESKHAGISSGGLNIFLSCWILMTKNLPSFCLHCNVNLQLDFSSWGWNIVTCITKIRESSEYLVTRRFFIFIIL